MFTGSHIVLELVLLSVSSETNRFEIYGLCGLKSLLKVISSISVVLFYSLFFCGSRQTNMYIVSKSEERMNVCVCAHVCVGIYAQKDYPKCNIKNINKIYK